MSTFQTLLALVVLIYVLSVIVQALQEFFKGLYTSKAKTMRKAIDEFMGDHLPVSMVEGALQQRGLDITALEHFNKDDFRHLLDAIQNLEPRLDGLVASATATFEQKKDNVAAAYEAARAKFEASYTKHNKFCVRVFSAVVVLVLNANLIFLYQELATDQAMSQAIAGTADALVHGKSAQPPAAAAGASTPTQPDPNKPQQPAGKKPVAAQAAVTQPAPSAAGAQKVQPAQAQPQASPAPTGQPDKTNPAQAQICSPQPASTDPAKDYTDTRDCVNKLLKQYPILVRWVPGKGLHGWGAQLCDDLKSNGWAQTLLGLALMSILVSLGAPFWNDVLKGATGVNNALNTGNKKTS